MDGVSPFDQKESNIIKFFQKRACVNDPFVVVYRHWGISAVGSAFEWHSKSRGFESHMLHFFFLQIWFIGRTLASQAGKAGSIPVICFFDGCGNPCKCWIFPLFTRVSGVFGASTTKAYFSIKNPFFWGNITRNITRKKGCFSFIFKE